jgi:hypothetical protein
MDKKIIIIIILSLIILGGVGIFSYNQIIDVAYQQGVQDAVLLINQQILNGLQQNGYVPFVFIIGNETQTINLVPYQE